MLLAELIADGEVRLVDGTLIACANYPGYRSLSEFAGHASYGYCPSKSLFVWGMHLVLISDSKGVPVGHDLTGPKTGQERECALISPRLTPAAPCSLIRASGATSTTTAWN
jgi:hypothetical protein